MGEGKRVIKLSISKKINILYSTDTLNDLKYKMLLLIETFIPTKKVTPDTI